MCARVGENACHECVYIVCTYIRAYTYIGRTCGGDTRIAHAIALINSAAAVVDRSTTAVREILNSSCCCRVAYMHIFLHTQGEPRRRRFGAGRLYEAKGGREGSGKNPWRSGRRGRNPGRTRVRSFRLKPTPQQVDTRAYLIIIYSQS